MGNLGPFLKKLQKKKESLIHLGSLLGGVLGPTSPELILEWDWNGIQSLPLIESWGSGISQEGLKIGVFSFQFHSLVILFW